MRVPLWLRWVRAIAIGAVGYALGGVTVELLRPAQPPPKPADSEPTESRGRLPQFRLPAPQPAAATDQSVRRELPKQLLALPAPEEG
jgi:hypothetical protein